MLASAVIASAYLLGSIPVGLLIARLKGVDIRSIGSGNIGATNVGRALGRKLGVLVFGLDLMKGALPPLLVRSMHGPEWLQVAAGLASFLGHIFPIWLRFQGGKGIATGAGVVAILLTWPTAGALLIWVTTFAATRIVSLASLLGAAALLALRFILVEHPFASEHLAVTLFALVAVAFVTVRHWSNILRLWNGAEAPVTDKSWPMGLARVLHVLAMSLWFGGGVFFTFVAAVQIFGTLERLGTMPPGERPEYLTLSSSYDKQAGTRLAGEVVAPMFPKYFALQAACGAVAWITAWGFLRAEGARRIHRVRFWLIAAAVATVAIGWPLNLHVSELRQRRNAGNEAAQAAFGGRHAMSLFFNFGTLALVGGAMVCAASLPQSREKSSD